jgi:hypothetical protein
MAMFFSLFSAKKAQIPPQKPAPVARVHRESFLQRGILVAVFSRRACTIPTDYARPHWEFGLGVIGFVDLANGYGGLPLGGFDVSAGACSVKR